MVVACNVYAQAKRCNGSRHGSPAASAKASKKANSQLGRKVRAAISKTQGVDVSNISVRARGGAVTLTGSVPDQGRDRRGRRGRRRARRGRDVGVEQAVGDAAVSVTSGRIGQPARRRADRLRKWARWRRKPLFTRLFTTALRSALGGSRRNAPFDACGSGNPAGAFFVTRLRAIIRKQRRWRRRSSMRCGAAPSSGCAQ